MIDAAIGKIQRLVETFEVECRDQDAQEALGHFLETVKVNAGQRGIQSFLGCYLEQLLLFGTAVGEIVPSLGAAEIAALYNANLDDLEVKGREKPAGSGYLQEGEWTQRAGKIS